MTMPSGLGGLGGLNVLNGSPNKANLISPNKINGIQFSASAKDMSKS